MAFKKGHEKKGGRVKGAENKLTQSSRELFLETLEGQSEHIAAAFEKVRKDNPRAYLDLFAKYAQYFVPKKTESDVNLLGDLTQTIINLGNGQNPDETTT